MAGLLLVLLFIAVSTAAYDVDNTAQATFDYGGGPLSRTSNQVTVVVTPPPTSATIEFLRLTPDPAGTLLPGTEFGDSDPPGTFSAVSPLPGPGLLSAATHFVSSEMVVIRLSDADRNLDPLLTENILVRLGASATGDSELLRLTETGPNTGTYAGYIHLDPASPSQYDGRLSVTSNDIIRADYADPLNGDTANETSLVDPYGFVFDSVSGAPLDGVEVILIDESTGLEATTVVGDDGAPYPGRVLTGSVLTAGSLTYNFPPGGYRFPSIPSGDYRLLIVPPSGYSFPSSNPAPSGSYVVLAPESYGGVMTINSAVPIRVDVPLDPLTSAVDELWLRMTTDSALVASGDVLTYTLVVENTGSTTATAVTVDQVLPAGFRYRAGSTSIGGLPATDPAVSANGSSLAFAVGDIPAGTSVEVTFRSMVGAVVPGEYPSNSLARATSGQHSNAADVSVRVRDELGNGKSFIAGRVVAGCDGEQGVEGVRLYLEDGTYVITDSKGRYHIEGVAPGTHVVQLDPITLPDGYEPVLCEDHTRFAGNPSSRFVELQAGTLWRADFAIADKPVNGEIAISLDNAYEIGSAATYTVSLSGRDVPFGNRRLEIALPPEAEYLPGTTVLNGLSFDDPAMSGQTLIYPLPDTSGTWDDTLTIRAFIDQNSQTGEMLAHARLRFDTPAAEQLVTPDAESALIWISRGERAEVQELFLRPHFDTLDAELGAADLDSLDETIRQLQSLDLVRIYVIGHTDARHIRWHDGVPYRDNFELSRARAGAVARAIKDALDIGADKIVTIGLAAADPIADNDSDTGMALNRRTDLRVLHRVIIDPEQEKIGSTGGQVRSLEAPGARQPAGHPKEELPVGILAPADGQNLPHRIESIKVRIDAQLKPRLSLDGNEIPAGRVGYRLQEPGSGTVMLTYIGTDFGEPGEHTLKIEGLDPFGNVRYTQAIRVNRTGDIARIDILESDGNVADGRSPVKVRLALHDAMGRLIPDGARLEIRGGGLVPLDRGDTHLPGAPESTMVEVDRNGVALFEPVSQSGSYRLVLGFGEIEAEADLYIRPENRDWILVGLGEGTAGYNSISGSLQPLDPNAPAEDYYDDGRLAFFAKGQVRGDWLLTLAYDSDKEDLKDRSLHQVIDPGTYYTVYGDTTDQGYEAASGEKLYVRIERERFYAVFGDIETGLNVTELARYNRSLTGFKSEWNGRAAGYSAFASETAQGFVRDEIQGDGTSGLYRLSSSDIVINSEKIILETRDRFHSERILESRSLQRHLDYDIDYDDGTLFFKEPVPSRDPDWNPVYITVDYETTAKGREDVTYGGRAYGRLADDDVEIGASHVHEGRNAVESDLYGVDASIRLPGNTTLRGEWATTETTSPVSDTDGDAWRAEIERHTRQLDWSAYIREQQPGFGLGQQNASESGMRKYGADLSYRLGEQVGLTAEVYRQENLISGLERSVGEAEVRHRAGRYSLSAGLRHAEDEPVGGASESSDQAMLGVDYHVTDKLDVTLRQEQSVGANENRDYPTRTLVGTEYRVNNAVSLFAEQEVTSGDAADTASTRLGLNAAPWNGAQVRTSVEQNLTESGHRTFGNLGLLQSWQLTPRLSAGVSIDRSQTLSGQSGSSLNPAQPPASGSPEDFTAVSTGLSWRGHVRTFDTRIEYRTSDTEDKWGVFAGSIIEPESFLGLSLHGSFFNIDRTDDSRSRNAELSFGLAWRPDNRAWLVLNRLDLVTAEDVTTTSTSRHWKTVERLNAFWRAGERNRLAFKFGARYAADEFDATDYAGMTWLLGGEWRHDLGRRFDIGLHGSLLDVAQLSQSLYHSGASIGYSPARNVWISLGYNLQGFRDDDFSAADYTAQGPYVKFRFKFDQNSIRDALTWLSRN